MADHQNYEEKKNGYYFKPLNFGDNVLQQQENDTPCPEMTLRTKLQKQL